MKQACHSNQMRTRLNEELKIKNSCSHVAKLIISESELHRVQSTHRVQDKKVRNYSAPSRQPDQHKYTWAGPQANLHLYWSRRLYGVNGSLSFSGCSDAHGGLEATDLITLQRTVRFKYSGDN